MFVFVNIRYIFRIYSELTFQQQRCEYYIGCSVRCNKAVFSRSHYIPCKRGIHIAQEPFAVWFVDLCCIVICSIFDNLILPHQYKGKIFVWVYEFGMIKEQN